MWTQGQKTKADPHCWCRQWLWPPVQWSLCHYNRCAPTSFCLTRLEPRDDHARPGALLPQVSPNAHSATKVPPISIPYPAPSEPKYINITAINIDALAEAWATVTIPAGIRPNQHGSLRCKVDTGASGNVMPLHIFAKLFPRHIPRDGKPTKLHPHDTTLMAYNGSNIPQFGTLDTATELTPKGHQCSKHLQTRWYVADSPGPTILGLPSSSNMEIVQLNCAITLTSRCDPPILPKKPKTEHAKDRHDLTSPFNSSEDLIKAYPNWFESIGGFTGTYHITLCDDAKPVVHAPRKCPIAMQPLVHEKLNEFIDQGIIFSSWRALLIGSLHLPIHGRQMGNYESALTQRIIIQLLDMITTKPLQWKK